MAEPLKNWISRDLLEPVVRELRLVWPAFDTSGFFNRVFNAGWEALELKQRIRRRQPFRDYTTRKHYAGAHRLAILVNGRPLAEKMFEVVPPA